MCVWRAAWNILLWFTGKDACPNPVVGGLVEGSVESYCSEARPEQQDPGQPGTPTEKSTQRHVSSWGCRGHHGDGHRKNMKGAFS